MDGIEVHILIVAYLAPSGLLQGFLQTAHTDKVIVPRFVYLRPTATEHLLIEVRGTHVYLTRLAVVLTERVAVVFYSLFFVC